MKKSKGSVDNIAASSVQRNVQSEFVLKYKNDNAKLDGLVLFLNDQWFRSKSFKKAYDAVEELKKLSYKWRQWAYNVKLDIHLESF